MKKELSDRQKINIELAARADNKKSTKVLKNHIPHEEQESVKLDFYCECADPECKSRVPLTIGQYERLHTDKAQFVITKGHAEPDIEKVTKSGDTIAVVEKFALS